MRDLNYGGFRREPFRQGVETLPHQGRRGSTSYLRGDYLPKGVFPCCKLHQTAAQSLVTATWTKLLMEVTDIDNGDPAMAVLASDQIVIRHAGIYLVVGSAAFALNSTGQRFVGVRLNAVLTQSAGFPNGGAPCRGEAIDILNLVRGDVIDVAAWQGSGGNLSTDVAADNQPSIMVVKVAPPI